MSDITDALQTIDSFSNLTLDDRSAIAKLCEPIELKKNTVLAREGSNADRIYAILKGQVQIWIEYDSQNADLLATTYAPALVGEMSVIDELPRSATIIASTDIYAYSMEAVGFQKLLNERASIALSLLKGLSSMIRMSNDAFINELRLRNKELTKTNEELKETQAQLTQKERLSSLGCFSSMIMHDLRNPLFAIIAYTDLLEMKLSSQASHKDEMLNHIDQIRRESNRITNMTNEWLDYSRGEISLEYSPIKVDELFSQLKNEIQSMPRLGSIKISLRNNCSKDFLADNERLLRTLNNLADNAINACFDGGMIYLSADECGDYIRFNVQDNGTGMDIKTQQHIFEPFFSQSSRMGNGLGLYIVKTIVEAHKGWVKVKSLPGEGTTISIYLPIRP